MEIIEIKQRLRLSEVLNHYGLKPKLSTGSSSGMLLCPFHEDKTASLQVNLEKNFYNCHACGKTGDVIQFVQDYEKLSKHEAINKCKTLVSINDEGLRIMNEPKSQLLQDKERTAFLTKMFLSFRKGIFSSVPAREYCASRNLNYEILEMGFNSGQFHHGTRKDPVLINNCVELGLLTPYGTNSRTGGQSYRPFGNKGIVFPLKN